MKVDYPTPTVSELAGLGVGGGRKCAFPLSSWVQVRLTPDAIGPGTTL